MMGATSQSKAVPKSEGGDDKDRERARVRRSPSPSIEGDRARLWVFGGLSLTRVSEGAAAIIETCSLHSSIKCDVSSTQFDSSDIAVMGYMGSPCSFQDAAAMDSKLPFPEPSVKES